MATSSVRLGNPVRVARLSRRMHATAAEWVVVNNGVMGGRSTGFVAVEQGSLRLTLVTQRGGLTAGRVVCSTDSRPAPIEMPIPVAALLQQVAARLIRRN